MKEYTMKTSYEDMSQLISEMEGYKEKWNGETLDSIMAEFEIINEKVGYQQIQGDKAIMNMIQGKYGEIDANSKAVFFAYLTLLKFYKEGKRKYEIPKPALDLLGITDIDYIYGSSIRLPENSGSICINIEQTSAFSLYDYPIKDLFISVYNRGEFNAETVKQHGYGDKDADHILLLMAFSEIGTSYKTGADDMLYWIVPFRDDENIKDIVNNRLKHGDVTHEFENMAKSIMFFAMNLILYISSREKNDIIHVKNPIKDISRIKNKKKIRHALKLNMDPGYYHIKDDIALEKYNQIISSENDISLDSGRRIKLKGAWMVRGHWRNQAYGPALSLRKIIWIYPYFKGDINLKENGISLGYMPIPDI